MKRCMVMALFLALLAMAAAGCGGGGEAADGNGAGDNGASGSSLLEPERQAETASCAANRRTISSMVQQYAAMEGAYPTSIQKLVPDYLQSVPSCPSGGTYSLQGGTVVCSVHGK